jgi:hypothetical protein
MSVYYVDKFLYQVDRDPELLARYKAEPAALLADWEAGLGTQLGNGATVERTSWLSLTSGEREALIAHDYLALFEMGAHFVLNLTIFIGLYEEEYQATSGPLSFQLEMAQKLAPWLGKPYPNGYPPVSSTRYPGRGTAPRYR